MTKSLVIVESPAKAKTIKKFLGRNYVVKASIGHIIDLPKSKLGVDIDNNFEPDYITIRGKGPVLKEIRQEAKKAKNILLATDPDREGEAISWHLANALNIDEKTACRIEFNEITKNAIKNAIKKPRVIDKALVDAQQARRVLDRLVGYKISPLLWRNIRKGLSAGRVQSVATKIIKDREEEIQNFKPEEYWSLRLDLQNKNGETFEAKFFSDENGNKDLKNSEEINRILDKIKGKTLSVSSVKEGEKKRNPYMPFITSTLQQEASNKLGYSTKKTMSIAQQLYEGIDIEKEGTVGLITYMRTDSTRISKEAIDSTNEYISEAFGKEYLNKAEEKKSEKKDIQDAHEAIRPTDIDRTPSKIKSSLTKDQFNLYKLIWERLVASQMAPAVFVTLTIELEVEQIQFRASGSRLKFDGFLKVYSFATTSEDTYLPIIKEGEKVKVIKEDPKQHFTQPPARYTEASLVKTMEELGIGRPSTYSPTITTILSRGYVEKEGRYLKPTELGTIVTDILVNYFSEVLEVHFTAELEKSLDKIEDGNQDWKILIKNFYDSFGKMLEIAEKDMEEIDLVEESDEECKKCGKTMLIKHGRYGKFLACSGYPECTYTEPFVNKIGIKCPACDEGEVIERRSKKGRLFYGCSSFPKCRFVSWYRPIEKKCPRCNQLMVHKKNKKSEKIECSNKDCGYQEKIEN
ncbi:type I DNA topoisomerase [Alkaliphilus peptidifermentans]|uniref:DNA topoisomerase 1 n=1 Tax=Alkaliphilus peptidifermentans DSM 18978 TaxID=1120976 RepID=A0A1G5DJ51_9FIRM|nr:type I DNA topoisomerase [Alkaliphilus peptidifermentans]SCY14715.1 DNA topoisomerase I [Alkaliphilus peptidifermentans DSM 18978]